MLDSAMSEPTTVPELAVRLATLGPADARRLGKRLSETRRIKDRARRKTAIAEISAQIGRAEQRLGRRRAAVPTITFPPDLPVSARVEDLAAAIAANQVVIVAGETGSGKSTQLPKICLQLGRGVGGMIGHTQPRRIAARALAERIAEETGTEVGGIVGYSIRFGDHTSPETMVKLMTDGILLAEIHRDPDLLAYDTIILDEAHERSLNVDFLIGYLTRLLPRRPDLKVIITSATIDPLRFSRHFGDAPVVEVSGRTYPVEIRYRPYGPDTDIDDDEDPDQPAARRNPQPSNGIDQTQAICDAVDELSGDGDILVFLSGEREITDTADALRAHLASRPRRTEVLPLYGRLSAADQHKVFSAHTGRRIVLATNVAETSLTVPGIRYVIDPGTARISRYSTRTKVQRLPIEKISQASAGQRAGRCGRVADGICIRLYGEDDFAARPEFTDPEIARTSLASVILQMAALGLGEIETFPFLEPPDAKQIRDGITVLAELGALDADGRLTATGRSVAALPIDPRLARMVIEGDKRNCLAEILVIVAALAIQDVREYPIEERDKATAAHSRFADPGSDFLALLGLWQYLRTQAKNLSGNAFRRMCRTEYLHYLRIREWQDLHAQLRQVAKGLKLNVSRGIGERAEDPDRKGRRTPDAGQQGRGSLAVQGVDGQAVHTALLSGLLSHIGLKDEKDDKQRGGKRPGPREYQGARGTSFVIWPGSALAKNPPRLAVAAELVETSRLWGRTVAAVEPEWVEQVGGDLLRYSHSEPRWDARRAAVMATEKVTLLGVTLVGARSVQFNRIDPVTSRELFIRHALVEGDWETRHAFFAANRRAMEQVAEQEDRVRRRDILLDDQAMFELYDARIPADVTSGRHFDAWWRRQSRTTPDLLTFTPQMLMAAGAGDIDPADYPDRYTTSSVGIPLDLPLDYVFDPARADDGVSLTIPLAVLARVDPAAFGGQIPGLRRDLAIGLLRSLPKTLRRNFVPAGDFADAALAGIAPDAGDLAAELASRLTRLTGIVVRTEDFDLDKIPDHLRMTYKVVDDTGTQVAAGKDLAVLQSGLAARGRSAVAKASGGVERTGLTTFPGEGIPERVDSMVGGQQVVGYPALRDEGTTVGVRVHTNPADQRRGMRAGTCRLLTLQLTPPLAHVRKGLTRSQQLTISAHGDLGALVADATEAAVDALLDWAGGPAFTAAAFERVRTRIEAALPKAVFEIVLATTQVLAAAHQASLAIDAAARRVPADQLADLRAQLAGATAPGFITAAAAAALPDLARHLTALRIRAERAAENPARDRQRMAEIAPLQKLVDETMAALPADRHQDAEVRELRRMLAEFRVVVFAQPMRTSIPVSDKRIRTAAAALMG